MNCPVCNGESFVKRGVEYGGYELHHCPTCDLLCWQPMRSPGGGWYDEGLITGWATIKPVGGAFPTYRKFFRDMPTRGGRVLDVGCGTGDFCYLAEKAGYSATGMDFSPQLIEVARQRFPSLDLEVATLEEFIARRPNDKYDVVTFIQVLEHLDNPRDFLQSVKAVLKPGGYVVCDVPNRERWRFLSPLLLSKGEYPPHHFTWWNSKCLARLFESSGFSILSLEIDPTAYFDCAPLIYEKFQWLAMQVWRGFFNNTKKPNTSLLPTMAKNPPLVIRFAYWLYSQVLSRLCGIITAPLVPFLRKSGAFIYLVAQLKVESTPNH